MSKTVEVCVGLYGMEGICGGMGGAIQAMKLAEDCGIDQVSITDHVVMGTKTDKYPYGEFPSPPAAPWYEPHTVLSAIAGATQRIKLSAGVIISPLRSAVLFAKQMATLDVISGGRVQIGVGSGWQREEFEASGLDFDNRYQMLEDQIRACRALWTQESVSLDLETVKLDTIYCHPLPQQARLPVWFGLKPLARNAQRIAELGDGWIPIVQDPDEIARGIDTLHRAFEQAGRKPGELAVRAMPSVVFGAGGVPDLEATLAGAQAYIDAGATCLEFLPLYFAQDSGQLESVFRAIASVKG
ncbi:MAG: TIGR03619 family F420-dependent LLM class oxidoreductase [Halioglobus sp.]|nr:TIGR03619 family F420-dependent LLM class oxidoreductase [Halioglobus sp.]